MTLRLSSGSLCCTLPFALSIVLAWLSTSAIRNAFERAEVERTERVLDRTKEALGIELQVAAERMAARATEIGIQRLLATDAPASPAVAAELHADAPVAILRAPDGSIRTVAATGTTTAIVERLARWVRALPAPPAPQQGLLASGDSPWIVSVIAVDAPPPADEGLVALAQPISSEAYDRVFRLTRRAMSIREPLSIDAERIARTHGERLVRVPRTDHTVDVLETIRDIAGQPLVLQVSLDRELERESRTRRITAAATCVAVGLAGSLLMAARRRRTVVRPVQAFTHELRAIRNSSDLKRRVSVADAGDLAGLATEINEVLADTERIDDRLRSLNSDLERRAAERTAELEASRDVIAQDAQRRLALAEKERIYRTLYDLMPSGMMLESDDGIILDCNQALCAMLGYDRSELIGRNIRMLVPESARPQVDENLARLRTGERLHHEVQTMRHDGSLIHVELREAMISLEDGSRRILVVSNDVTRHHLDEEKLRASEKRYRDLFDSMNSGFALHEIICDAGGHPIDYIFLDVNRAFETLLGIRREDTIGRSARALFPGLEPEWIERYGRIALGAKSESFEAHVASLGRQFAITAYSPRPRQFATTFTDITDQKKAEATLRIQGAALDTAANAVMIVSSQGTITWVNRAFTELTGYEAIEAVGQNPRLLKSQRQPREFYTEMWQTVLAGHRWHGQLWNKRKDGTLYLEEMTITPVRGEGGAVTHLVGIKQDISERQQLIEQLAQAQKMEGIGRLAGGIAHDFNNMMQAITGFSALLLESLGPTSPHREDVLEIDKAAKRAAGLTQQLLAFGRRQMIAPKHVQLNDLIRGIARMIERLVGEDIRLDLDLANDLEPVLIDVGQIEQVIVNLVLNARDAMPKGGRLSIKTENLVLLREDAVVGDEARHGRFSCMSITDTGVGMTRETIEHVFEPFYSTKGPGHGSGLGLSVAYGIVRQHEGMIRVYSEVGHGSTFRIYLPVARPRPVDEPAAPAAIAQAPLAPAEKAARILLVEDEQGVRDFAHRALSRNGYFVSRAGCVTDAVRLVEETVIPYDLLFTDVVLPDGNGLELANRLRETQPDLRIVFTSGYSDDKSRWADIRDRGYGFLQKPYPMQKLLDSIAAALRSPE